MENRFLRLLLFPFFSVIFISNCNDEKVIEENKFVQVYVDLLVLQDTTSLNLISPDSVQTLVFNKHNISAEDYRRTVEYYNTSPQKWEEFFNKATSYVEKLRQEGGN